MSTTSSLRRVSAVELVCVIVILGIVGALVIPRFGRAAEIGPEAQLRESLRLMRIAIARFHADHGYYPAQRPVDGWPANSPEAFWADLTGVPGQEHLAAESAPCFGPYLRDGLPPCPVPPNTGKVSVALLPLDPAEASGAGWLYDPQTGEIRANSDHCDGFGRCYSTY